MNGSGERSYHNLAATDREEQCRLSGCRGNSSDCDTGMLQSRRHRRIDDNVGALTETVARAGRYLEVAGGLGLVPLVAAGLPAAVLPPAPAVGAEVAREVLLPPELLVPDEPPLQAATASPADTSTAMTGCREQRHSKPISLLLRLAGRKRVEVACHVAFVQRAADDGGSTPERAYGGVVEQ